MPSPLDTFGFLPGEMKLNQPAMGIPRPFGRGEYMNNPDGSWSSEMTYTLQDPVLNGGKATIVPGLWIKDGKPYHATEDEAALLAAMSGLHWPAYASPKQAEDTANSREAAWQKVPREKAAMGAPLYIVPHSKPQGR